MSERETELEYMRVTAPSRFHRCNARCDGQTETHCELVYMRPVAEVNIVGGNRPPDEDIARSLLSIGFHVHGWHVVACERAVEAPPSIDERTEPWLLFLAPCPDCGPPTRPPFEMYTGAFADKW